MKTPKNNPMLVFEWKEFVKEAQEGQKLSRSGAYKLIAEKYNVSYSCVYYWLNKKKCKKYKYPTRKRNLRELSKQQIETAKRRRRQALKYIHLSSILNSIFEKTLGEKDFSLEDIIGELKFFISAPENIQYVNEVMKYLPIKEKKGKYYFDRDFINQEDVQYQVRYKKRKKAD